MLSCLEYMYHDLGLVKEFNMNPITLKRWLVKVELYKSNYLNVQVDMQLIWYNNFKEENLKALMTIWIV